MRSADTEVQSKIEICAAVSEFEIPKLDLDTTGKINDLNDLLKGILKEKSPTTKKSADKSLSQPWCSHSITIYDVQLRKKNAHAARNHNSKQPWHNHCIANYDQIINKRIEARTHEQPLVVEHRGGTDYVLK